MMMILSAIEKENNPSSQLMYQKPSNLVKKNRKSSSVQCKSIIYKWKETLNNIMAKIKLCPLVVTYSRFLIRTKIIK